MPFAKTAAASPDLDAKRRMIFASLIRYSPETVPLRERILDRVVLTGLAGSNNSNTFKIGQIIGNLVTASTCTQFRVERVQEALQRLAHSGHVDYVETFKKKSYFLTSSGEAELNRVIRSSEDLFKPVLDRLLEHTGHLASREVGESVCQNFLFECFARFGAQIVKSITGRLEISDLMHHSDVQAAFDAAARPFQLTDEAIDSFFSRCSAFLKSTDSIDVTLKFQLTQGFYLAQLVELVPTDLSPLTQQAFEGATFFLDTNVVILGVLSDGGPNLFDEMISIARRFGISVKVTRATINETLGTIDEHASGLSKVIGAVPDSLVKRTNDQIYAAYEHAQLSNIDLTFEQFANDARSQLSQLSATHGIDVVEITESEMLKSRDLAGISQAIQEAAMATRGWEKPEQTLLHDTAHYALVTDVRHENPKTWFLTKDRGLLLASTRLQSVHGLPFAFDVAGFLQTVSPFLTSEAEFAAVAQVLSTLIADQVLPKDTLFNTRELSLLVQMHQDVLATPEEDLLRAVDYVKTTVLAGKQYRAADYNHVALGLKSFLASSADEQRREIEAQRERARAEADKERAAAIEERALRISLQEQAAAQLKELADVKEAKAAQDAEIARLQAEVNSQKITITSLESFRKQLERDRKFQSLRNSVIALCIALLIWLFASRIAGYVQWKANLVNHWTAILFGVRFAGFPFYLVFVAWTIKNFHWTDTNRAALASGMLLLATWATRIAEGPTYAITTMCTVIGSIIVGFVTSKATKAN
jgi:hypothetical protein